MHKLSTRQWTILVLLTLTWGINWPIMKLGVTGFPPLTFRMMCLWLGTPVLGLALLFMKVPFRIPRAHWRELLVLAVFNMFIWHALIIIAVQSLSSGRAAILGYTMPIFRRYWGRWCLATNWSSAHGPAWLQRVWVWCCCCGMSCPT